MVLEGVSKIPRPSGGQGDHVRDRPSGFDVEQRAEVRLGHADIQQHGEGRQVRAGGAIARRGLQLHVPLMRPLQVDLEDSDGVVVGVAGRDRVQDIDDLVGRAAQGRVVGLRVGLHDLERGDVSVDRAEQNREGERLGTAGDGRVDHVGRERGVVFDDTGGDGIEGFNGLDRVHGINLSCLQFALMRSVACCR